MFEIYRISEAWQTAKNLAFRSSSHRVQSLFTIYQMEATFVSVQQFLTGGDRRQPSHKMHDAGIKAWKTRRIKKAWIQAHAAEAASKAAFKAQFEKEGWRIAFFEGATGAPRTGIIDAVAFRLNPNKPDILDLRLVQLKGGRAGVSGYEVARLKKAARAVAVNWLVAEFDGQTLHLLPGGAEQS